MSGDHFMIAELSSVRHTGSAQLMSGFVSYTAFCWHLFELPGEVSDRRHNPVKDRGGVTPKM